MCQKNDVDDNDNNIVYISNSVFQAKVLFYLPMHSTHFIYGYAVSNLSLRTDEVTREETIAATSLATLCKYFICTIPQTG